MPKLIKRRLTMRLLFLTFFSLLTHSYAYEVLTISDSIVDHILYVDEEYVNSLPGKIGGSALVDDATFKEILSKSNATPSIRPGASAVNTIKGLQQLGHHCALITTVGEDPEGDFFLRSLDTQGVVLFLKKSLTPTGKSACLVTPNKERTMRTYLGASRENHLLELKPEMFRNVSHFHLEGYQLKHQTLVKEAVALARENSATISIDLSSFEVVKSNQELIWDLLKNKEIDILFANREEAFALTGLDPQEASEHLAHYCDIAVVTVGENGCYTTRGSSQWKCPALNVEAVDTIGAGDLFISGFLHGFLTDQPVSTCACWGTLLASRVVQVLGAEIPSDQWDTIRTLIAKL